MTTQTVTVQVNGDTTVEPNETFNVNLSSATGNATIADAQGVGTIVNDDAAAPTLTIDDVSHNEGNSGTTNARVHGHRSAAAQAAPVTVDFATADGTATAPQRLHGDLGHADLRPRRDHPDGDRAGHGDTTVEPNETFTVNLSSATGNATIADAQGVGTIVNDDAAAASNITINDVSHHRGQQRDHRVRLHGLARRRPGRAGDGRLRDRRRHGHRPQRLHGDLGDGDLRPRRDHADGDGAGQRRHHRGAERDVHREPLEPTANATITDAQGVGTIVNDDQPAISINDPVAVTRERCDFTVSLDQPSNQTVTVDFATANGTGANGAVAPGDYTSNTGTVTFAPGVTSQTVTVQTIDDNSLREPRRSS